jgi:plasmid maintenance system antidote protein VapI
MSSPKDKLSRLAADRPSEWKTKAQYRRENRRWLKKAAAIAEQVLDALKTKNIPQKELAERMSFSSEQISKIVKGQENLTLEMIAKLEVALDIRITFAFL